MASSVKILGLDRPQANGLAILFESSPFIELINDELSKKFGTNVAPLSDCPNIIFDDSDYSVDHEITF